MWRHGLVPSSQNVTAGSDRPPEVLPTHRSSHLFAKTEKAIAGIIAAIEEGLYQPSMKARIEELERQKADLIARLTEAPDESPDILPSVSGGRAPGGGVAGWSKAASERADWVRCSEGAALRRSPAISG
jgi:hypothetical protein